MTNRLILLAILATNLVVYAQPTRRPATFTISGVVINAVTNQPVPYARMTLLTTATDPVAQVTAGSDGRFQFAPVPAAKYQLLGQRTGFPRQGLNQHEDFFTGVVTGPGQNTTSIVFRLKPEATISGRILDDFGDPVEGASIMLFRRAPLAGHTVTSHYANDYTDDTGSFRIESLLPGTYFLAVYAQPWYATSQPTLIKTADELKLRAPASLDVAYPTTFYPGTTEVAAASPIQLKAGADFTADFQLKAVPAAHILVDASEHDSLDVTTSLFDIGGPQRIGTQNFRSSDGQSELTGFAPGPVSLNLTQFTEDYTRSDSRQLSLDAGPVTSLTRAAMNYATNFSGTIEVDGEPNPLENASLALRDRTSGRLYFVRVEANNFFTDHALPVGRYDIYLFAPGYYLAALNGSGASPDGKSVDIKSESATDFKIELSKQVGNIEGVAMLDGKPFGGALILAISETDPQDQRWDRLDQSDSDGTFRLRDLVPGSYKVVALQNGWDLDHADRKIIQPFLSRAQHIELGPGDTGTLQLPVQ